MLNNNINISITQSFSDYWHSFRLYSKRVDKFSNSFNFILQSIFFIFSVYLLFSGLIFQGGFLLFVFFLISTNDYFQAKSIWFSFKHPRNELEINIEATQDYIRFKSNYYEEIIRWDYFIGYVEDKKVILLLTGKRVYYFIPKRFFASAEQLNEFKELLKEKIRK